MSNKEKTKQDLQEGLDNFLKKVLEDTRKEIGKHEVSKRRKRK